MKIKCVITNIDWDTDGEVVKSLPTETTLIFETDTPKIVDGLVENIRDLDYEVADMLSDEYGFCVEAFSVSYLDENGNAIECPDEFGEYVNEIEGKVS
jgi:hypothetical protein